MSDEYQLWKPRFWRTLVVGFVLLSCLRAWIGTAPQSDVALAQIPDSGLQRKLLIEESKRTNQLLTEIRQILSERTFNVRIQGADNNGADN